MTTTATASLPLEPDRIARKLFIMTVIGACTFAIIVIAMTHFFPAELDPTSTPIAPLVRLVPEH